MIAPGVVASLMLTFTVSFDEFILAFFLSGTQPTLPMYIWSQLRFPQEFPSVLALATLIIGTSFVLGSSGCGKTTLLRMLAGFELPTSGDIDIDGETMTDVPPHHRPVNMVFQNYAIFPHLNVKANIAYGLRKLGLSRAERDQRVEEALELIKLPGYGSRRANELSGGQRQRVALARALVLQPKVLLLDEPLGALDKQLREEMQSELRSLQKTVGITFVFVTHDQEEALALSDRIAVMEAGEILQVDSPARLYNQPNSKAVASFVGNMNFFSAIVKGNEDGKIVFDAEGLGLVSQAGEPMAEGTRVELAMRPERFVLEADNDGSGVSASVIDSAFLGERQQYRIKLDGREQPLIVSGAAINNDGSRLNEAGNSAWLSWKQSEFVVLEG